MASNQLLQDILPSRFLFKIKDSNLLHNNFTRFLWVRSGGKHMVWGYSRAGCWEMNLFLGRRKWMEGSENWKVRNPVIYTPHDLLLQRSNQREWDDGGMCYAWKRREMYTEFWLGNLKGSDRMEGLGVDQAWTTRKVERVILIQRKKLPDTGVDSWGNTLLTVF